MFKFLIFFLILVILIPLGVIFYLEKEIIASAGIEEDVSFEILPGENVSIVADKLEKEGLVKNGLFFSYYIMKRDWSKKLQAGKYDLSPAMSPEEIAKKIIVGDVVLSEVKVTFPEGFSVSQIEKRLIESGLIGEGELSNYKNKNYPEGLEGYLFPDTYIFSKENNVAEIVDKMTKNFESKISEEIHAEMKKKGLDLYEVLKMASVVEKEVRGEEDMKMVSGVFWNRIKLGMPLQSCATIAYILGVDKWRYTYEDTKIESPFNTYLHAGLPPRPICNPGIAAIEAAVYPVETDFLYFLSRPDTGETIFSKTLDEHNANKVKYLGN